MLEERPHDAAVLPKPRCDFRQIGFPNYSYALVAASTNGHRLRDPAAVEQHTVGIRFLVIVHSLEPFGQVALTARLSGHLPHRIERRSHRDRVVTVKRCFLGSSW